VNGQILVMPLLTNYATSTKLVKPYFLLSVKGGLHGDAELVLPIEDIGNESAHRHLGPDGISLFSGSCPDTEKLAPRFKWNGIVRIVALRRAYDR
jgi:hypothetical protein